ncbi:hypothetical protein [Sphingobium yanoikuyae]|uniref:hypothetical protein n=1 Tax=Sphingobium yanoikuyae TaxID=13690 RepID=UPI0022DD1AA1|nr:hypothetical protein [Sphingobium yanoikuyae]WBQ17727.1 hypothetical protein PAE53_05850 [Sphingobium yanoikuyae]
MKLPDRLGRRLGRPFHSAVATSFAVEFAAVEEILLPQLMASGAFNLLLITDARMAALALSDGSTLPTALGRDYALYSPPAVEGIFHPKIILEIGRESARAFVSSANLTASGLAGNAEVVIEIECRDEESAEREIIRAAWRYLNALVPMTPSPARDALLWARERAAWLDGPIGESLHELDDGTGIAFLHAPGEVGIGDQFVSFVGDEKVETLVVISPYWDSDLAALADLSRRLSPRKIILPIDPDAHEFPKDAPFAGKVRLVALQWPSYRFTHAKIIIATTARYDHVLLGSSNCTAAALGRPGAVGANAEACIYRRLPRGTAREALALDQWLDGEALDLDDLPEPAETPPIPLRDVEARQPGTFELDSGLLHWVPAHFDREALHVQLLDRHARLLVAIPAAAFQHSADRWTIAIDADVAPVLRFARLVDGEDFSTIAPVTHRAVLRSRRKEVATGAVARALIPFTTGADFDLWMHQAFETLARADFDTDQERARLSATRPQVRKPDSEMAAPVTLSYEDFTQAKADAGRQGRDGANSLAGTYSDSIRDFLNLLSGRASLPGADDDYDPAFDPPADESDGEEDADGPDTQALTSASSDEEEPRHEPINPRLYERHVTAYAEGLEEGDEPLGSSDVLRLRFWTLFLMYKGRCGDLPKGLETSSAALGWPRFLVRVLVGFFCGRKPAITRLMLARDYEAMPVDFMECWATILWALDAIERALVDRPRDRVFLKYIPGLRQRIISLLALAPAELHGNMMMDIRAGLDRSIGQRLGLAPPMDASAATAQGRSSTIKGDRG